MQKLLLYSFTVVVTGWVIACSQNNAETYVQVSDTVFYQAPGKIAGKSLRCYGVLSSQEIVLELPEGFPATPERYELTTGEGSRSHPNSVEVVGGKVRASFQPVSSRYLYQQTGLRGDLDSSFVLSVTTAQHTESFTFTANANYSASLEKFGLVNVTPYMLGEFTLSPEITAVSQTSLPLVRNNECLASGFWMKVESVFKDSTMTVNMRFVNQSQKDVVVDASRIRLNNVTPHFDSDDPTNVISIKNGGRAEVKMKYMVPKADTFMLDVSGIEHVGEGGQVFGGLFKLSAVHGAPAH
jgi:hypothetical protein